MNALARRALRALRPGPPSSFPPRLPASQLQFPTILCSVLVLTEMIPENNPIRFVWGLWCYRAMGL
eukprot:3455780-Pyramimonas_sp.AAC.1